MAGVKGRSGQKAEKPWHEALKVVVNQRDAAGVKLLRRMAEKTVAMALAGDMDAIKEIGNRLEGRSAQEVRLADADGDAFGAGLMASFEAAAVRAMESMAAADARLIGNEAAPVLMHAPAPMLPAPPVLPAPLVLPEQVAFPPVPVFQPCEFTATAGDDSPAPWFPPR